MSSISFQRDIVALLADNHRMSHVAVDGSGALELCGLISRTPADIDICGLAPLAHITAAALDYATLRANGYTLHEHEHNQGWPAFDVEKDGQSTTIEWINSRINPTPFFRPLDHPVYGPVADAFDIGMKKLGKVIYRPHAKLSHFEDLLALHEAGIPLEAMFIALGGRVSKNKTYEAMLTQILHHLELNVEQAEENPECIMRADFYYRIGRLLITVVENPPHPMAVGRVVKNAKNEITVPKGIIDRTDSVFTAIAPGHRLTERSIMRRHRARWQSFSAMCALSCFPA